MSLRAEALSSPEYEDLAVSNDITYYYRVVAVREGLQSDPSEAIDGTPTAPPRAPHFHGTVNDEWFVLGNWYADAAGLIPMDSFPIDGENVVILVPLTGSPPSPVHLSSLESHASISLSPEVTCDSFTQYGSGAVGGQFTANGGAFFYGTSSLDGQIDTSGTVYFDEFSQTGEGAVINGSAVFNSEATHWGAINGTATFNNQTLCHGTVTGSAVFSDESENAGVIDGDAVFSGSSQNSGTVTGMATIVYPAPLPLGGSCGSIAYDGYVFGCQDSSGSNYDPTANADSPESIGGTSSCSYDPGEP